MTARTGLQLRSLVKPDGELEITLVDQTVPAPGPDEVVVRVEATPLNPSDLGLLFGAADLSTLKVGGTAARPVVTARVPERAMPSMGARVGQAMPVGNEGSGTVVEAGSSPEAQALAGRVVALIGGALGLLLTPLVARVVHGAVPQFSRFEVLPETYAQQALAIVAVGVLAALVPMLRSARVRIVDGLRHIG